MYNEPLKIQIGKLYINSTRKYLLPIVKSYGVPFTERINKLSKVGVGIGDFILASTNIYHEKHLFILVDTRPNRVYFDQTLKYLRDHPAYEDDYVFDKVHGGRLHMLVIVIPDEFRETLSKFKNGEYSKMYSKEDIKRLFSYTGKDESVKKMYEETQKILIHDHNYRITFAKRIAKEFDLHEIPEVSEDQEFELPISAIQENFFSKFTNDTN